MTIAQCLALAKKQLTHSGTPLLDGQILLSHLLGADKTFLFLHGDDDLAPEKEAEFRALLGRRAAGMPVAYLTGTKEFYGRDFCVTPAVLIPKPDTETLVELAVDRCARRLAAHGKSPLLIADVCCGSGCIGISVLAELLQRFPRADIAAHCTDISGGALDIAMRNAARLLPESAQIVFFEGDLLAPLIQTGKKYQLILSNPPYVPSAVTERLLSDGRSEPRLALDGGSDGLDIIRRLIPQAAQCIARGGEVLIESGEYNAAETAALLGKAGFRSVRAHRDLAGMPRVTSASCEGKRR